MHRNLSAMKGEKMTEQPTNVPKLLNRDDLRAAGIKYCREQLFRLEKARKFPRRLRLSPARVVWYEHEILAWLNEHDVARETQQYADHD